MIFFTRQLHDALQDDSGRSRRAAREWIKRAEMYRQYQSAIAPLLPASVRRLCRASLHDARVKSATQRRGTITLAVAARRALGGFRGHRVRLTFRGVKRPIRTQGLKGNWWLYEEAHLSSHARFALHVLLDREELEIEADELLIEKM